MRKSGIPPAIHVWDYAIFDSCNIGVVRGHADEGAEVLIRPAYVASNGKFRKLGPADVRHYTGDGEEECFFDYCTFRRCDDIVKLRSWDSVRFEQVASKAPRSLRRLAASLEGDGCAIHLYGSRLLGVDRPDSDWDLLLTVQEDPRSRLHDALSETHAGHLLCDSVLRRHAREYAYPPGVISSGDLLEVMKSALTFIRVGAVQADLLPNLSLYEQLPRRFVKAMPRLEGTLVSNGGRSYGIPRIVSIEVGSGEVVEIRHLNWRLAGLERLAGHHVLFQNLYASVGSNQLWLGARQSGFQLQ